MVNRLDPSQHSSTIFQSESETIFCFWLCFLSGWQGALALCMRFAVALLLGHHNLIWWEAHVREWTDFFSSLVQHPLNPYLQLSSLILLLWINFFNLCLNKQVYSWIAFGVALIEHGLDAQKSLWLVKIELGLICWCLINMARDGFCKMNRQLKQRHIFLRAP